MRFILLLNFLYFFKFPTIENYGDIQKEMEKNVLPTKKNMIKQISDIIESEIFN